MRMQRRAFTLMETILAAAILSLTVMVLFNLLPSSMLASRRAEHRIMAATLAETILQTECAQPFATLVALVHSKDTTGVPDELDWHAPYRFSWTASPPPPPGDDRMQLVARFRVRAVKGADAGKLVCVQVSVRWCEKAQDRNAAELTAAFANQEDPRYQEITRELWYGTLQP